MGNQRCIQGKSTKLIKDIKEKIKGQIKEILSDQHLKEAQEKST